MLRPSELATELGRFVRFGIVGILATLVYVVTAYVSVEFVRLAPTHGGVVGQLASMVVSYFGHAMFSFQVEPDRRGYVIRFVLTWILVLVVNVGLTWLLSSVFRLTPLPTIIIVTIVIPAITYLMNRFWVFMPGLKELPDTATGEGRSYT